MAFWRRDEETEWEKYEKAKKRRKQPETGEKPTVSQEFQSYFKTVRQAQSPEGGEPAQPGEQTSPIQTFLSRFRADDKSGEPEGPPEKCPWCGKDMQRGYLSGDRGVFWSPKKPGLFTFRETVDLKDEGGLLENLYKVCWFCQPCRKLILDTSGLEPPLGTAPPVPHALSYDEQISAAKEETPGPQEHQEEETQGRA